MNNKKIIILSILTIINTSICYAYTYEKNGRLPPIKFTYKDLNKILSGLRTQIPITSDRYEKLIISGKDVTITKEDDFALSQNDRIPDKAAELSYSYSYSKGEITEILIRFNDNRRQISIEGSSPDSVNAIYAFLNDQFLEHKIIIGGKKFRIIGAVILFIIAMTFWMFSLLSQKNLLQISCAIIAAFIYLSTLLLPFSRWFPGFAIYNDSVSFPVRHAAQISLFGVILSLFLFIIGILITYFMTKNKK